MHSPRIMLKPNQIHRFSAPLWTVVSSLSRIQPWLTAGILGAAVWGYSPALDVVSGASFGRLSLRSASAQAQTPISVSDDEVMRYARAVLQMDGPRRQAYADIQNLLRGANYDVNQVDLACPNTRSLNQLPRSGRNDVRRIVTAYCDQASSIVAENRLAVTRFNQISAAYKRDEALEQRIYDALIQIQQQANE